MITTLLMIIGIITSIIYIIYALSTNTSDKSERIKRIKKLKIISLSMVFLCLIITILKFDNDMVNSAMWIFNTCIWLLNYYLNDKSLKNYQTQTPEKWEWLRYQNKNNNFDRMEKIEKEISKDNIWTKFVEWLKEK